MTVPASPRLATVHDAPALAASLRDAAWVAVDTEFHTERRYAPDLYLIQLALPDGAIWIVDPLDLDVLGAVGPALAAAKAWLVHAGEHDLRLLADACGGVPETVHDTQIAAGLVASVYPASLVELAALYAGVRLSKSETLSDWSRRPLSPGQLAYAADDVRHLGAIWATLAQHAEDTGRTDLVTEACAAAREASLTEADPADAWPRIGAYGLDDVDVAILRALLRWRDAAARQEDRPARSLLGDAALRQLATARPATVDALLSQRRVPRSFLKAHAPALLGLIATHAGAPPRRRRAMGRDQSLVSRALLAMIDAAGHERRFARALVVPDDNARDLVLWPGSPELPLSRPTRDEVRSHLGPWRDALAGDVLYDVLHGRLALTLGEAGPRLVQAF